MPFTESLATDDAFLRQMLLRMVQERSLPDLLHLVTRSLADTDQVALARIWLLDAGDICPSCHLAADCQERQHCLHLVASAGSSRVSNQQWDGLQGRFGASLGVRSVRSLSRIRASVPDISADQAWIADPDWAAAAAFKVTANPVGG